MSEPRVLKKYPNRRLYDTASSKYITLDDVRRLVLAGVPFVVRDAKTDDDITRSVLLQVIAEQEEAGQPIFTIPILTQIIRFYGDAMQGLASEFLQRSLDAFGEQQRLFRRQLDQVMAQDAVTTVADLTRRNLDLWKDAQGAWFAGAKDRRQPPPEPPAATRPKQKRKGPRVE
jgi:polyhydroxyalkanoate synthesis repressor PhaR